MIKTLALTLAAAICVAFAYFIVVAAIVYFTPPSGTFEMGPVHVVSSPVTQ